MGLQEVFKKAGQTIVKAFGNVPITVTYTEYGDKSYDEETDTVTTPETSIENVKMFFGPYSTNEQLSDSNIVGTDIKGLVAVNDLPGIKPSPNNIVTVTSSSSESIRSGDIYSVVGDFKTDEAEAMYEVHLRAVT